MMMLVVLVLDFCSSDGRNDHGFGDSDSGTGDNSLVFCLFFFVRDIFDHVFYVLPWTSKHLLRFGIWTLNTFAGGIWMSRVRNKLFLVMQAKKGLEFQ